MTDDMILKMYNNGYSINYIAKQYCRYLNKNSRPLFLDGVKLFPAKIYNKNYCLLYVNNLIYSNLLKRIKNT